MSEDMKQDGSGDEGLRTEVESQPLATRATLGLMVAGLFLIGLVALVLGGVGLYALGLPMVAIAVIAVAVLAGVFTLLRRWANS